MPPSAEHTGTPETGWLEKLGMHRPELRAWVMYDWANSAMAATIVAAVFPTYFQRVAASELPREIATQRFALATTIALSLVAVLAPVLGALADSRPIKKKLLAFFLWVGALAAAGMFFVHTGDWLLAVILFVFVNIGASGSFVFYDSLLPHVARPDEMDRVSTSGYAMGYLGGGLLLGLNLAWIQFPAWFGLPSGDDLSEAQTTLPARLAFVSVAIWWLGFSLPLFRRVPEPAARRPADWIAGANTVRAALLQLRETFGELRRYRQAVLMLLAFLIYNDGVLTIIRMSTIYGSEIGLSPGAMMTAILLVNFVGVPCAFGFGSLAGRIGAKASIYVALCVFAGIAFLGYRMTTVTEFFVLAILVSMVMGGTQALSRSLFASMIPKHKSSEFFALFAVMEKFAGILGPAVFAVMIEVTGSSRSAIFSIMSFFIVGGLLLRRVDVKAGRDAVRSEMSPPAEARDGGVTTGPA
ncbi:MAG: MFS transporter [Candidatus Krumholzibacteriia bacterium]